MKNPFEYFDKIFVISAKNSERRAYVHKTLADLNIKFQFFDAVMGKNLSDKEIEAVYDKQAAKNHKTIKRPMSKPEIGCTLSHLRICEKVVAKNMNNALIFEDDIAPKMENISLINSAIKELPEDWDLVYLGTWDHYKKPPLSFGLKLLFYFPIIKIITPQKLDYDYWHLWNLYPRGYSKNLKRPGFHLGSHAYAVSNKGAHKLLAYRNKIVTVIDTMISVMVVENRLNAFMTKEMIFEQNDAFTSSIQYV